MGWFVHELFVLHKSRSMAEGQVGRESTLTFPKLSLPSQDDLLQSKACKEQCLKPQFEAVKTIF